MWNDHQLSTYRKQGYLIQRGAVPKNQIEEMHAAANAAMSKRG